MSLGVGIGIAIGIGSLFLSFKSFRSFSSFSLLTPVGPDAILPPDSQPLTCRLKARPTPARAVTGECHQQEES